MSLTSESSRIAGRFLAARRAAAGLDAYPGDFPATLQDAYAIQDAAIASWGRPVIGWKVGRVHSPLAERFGTDRLAGPIFAQTLAPADGAAVAMPIFVDGFAAGESELLLRIRAVPPRRRPRLSPADRRRLPPRRRRAGIGAFACPTSPTPRSIKPRRVSAIIAGSSSPCCSLRP